VLGVYKDMNGECVWRMLGECRCERLPKNIMFCHIILQIIIFVWHYTTFVYVFL